MSDAATLNPATRLKPGVVSGKDYATLVAACKAGGYALPAVNVVGSDSINAVMEAAAKNKSDVIIQLSNGGARFMAGEGCPDAAKARVLPAIEAALARTPIRGRITLSGYEGSELLVARLLVESGADVRYVGTACPRTPWSEPDRDWLESRGIHTVAD